MTRRRRIGSERRVGRPKRWSVAVLLVAAALWARAPTHAQGFSLDFNGPVGARLYGGWELAPESAPLERPPDDAWRSVSVPAPFEHELGKSFDGVVWYRHDLRRDPVPPGRPVPRWRIEFRAAATAATVYWNGEPVGSHVGGWTPFEVALPAMPRGALDGRLEVRVDERVGHDTQGFLPVIQPHFGGLWQDVFLWREDAPTLDRNRLVTFGHWAAERLQVEGTVRGQRVGEPLDLVVEVTFDQARVASGRIPVGDDGTVRGSVDVPDPRGWAPGSPALHDVLLKLVRRADGRPQDGVHRRVGFRHVSTDGTRLCWNGRPLQVRGMLHWGFSPPDLAPPADTSTFPDARDGLDRWRRELEMLQALGCNLVKCCLWVPPREYYDVADELGILVWQEYPTWHAKLLEERLPALEREFTECFWHDRSHASVAFRSLTCESGADVDPIVLERLYALGHELVPNSLIVDNSSWISWMRVHDFWDDHPYGNNGGWPGELAEIRAYVAAREAQPILFGECIASDTWFDRAAWGATDPGYERWWTPWCLEAQVAFEDELRARWGDALVRSLLPVSTRYALRNRKYQCERLRLDLPDAGYVLSVIRDFPKARMGFVDDLDRPKWTPDEWAWHRDVMLCLDLADDRRACVPDGSVELPLVVSNFGAEELPPDLWLTTRLHAGDDVGASTHTALGVAVEPGELHAFDAPRVDVGPVTRPRRLRLMASLDGPGDPSTVAENAWDLWLLPPIEPPPEGPTVRVADDLDAALLEELEAGARVLLRAHPGAGSFQTSGIWYLKGAPWAPRHPLNEGVPRELLYDLQGFDLERPFVLFGERLFDEVEPILGFWDTHDVRAVNRWLCLFETRIGAGRLVVSALDHATPAGRWLEAQLVRHLADGPPPVRALAPETVDALGTALAGETIELDVWRFRTDPDDRGRDLGWHEGRETGAGWRDLSAGRHWESEGVTYDGAAWYARELDVPAAWAGKRVHAVFDGVDDSYALYVNGRLVARHGDPETGETVWLVRTTAELTDALEPGRTNRIVLRVVDHQGAGGLHRRAVVTTGWAGDAGAELLN